MLVSLSQVSDDVHDDQHSLLSAPLTRTLVEYFKVLFITLVSYAERWVYIRKQVHASTYNTGTFQFHPSFKEFGMVYILNLHSMRH